MPPAPTLLFLEGVIYIETMPLHKAHSALRDGSIDA